MINTLLICLGLIGTVVSEPPSGYNANAIRHGYGAPHSAYGPPQGHGAPQGHGYGGGLFGGGGILSSFLGGLAASAPVQVSHGGYGGYNRPKQHGGFSHGNEINYGGSARGIGGGFNIGNQHGRGGIRVKYASSNPPIPTVHDDDPWVPIKSAPVDVVLKKPAHEYGAESSTSISYTPSMSYGYSYKLIPTFAYGPTYSNGGVGYGR